MTGETGARWRSGGRISDDVGACEGEGGEGRERTVKLGTGHTCDGRGEWRYGKVGLRDEVGRYACIQHSDLKKRQTA